MSTETKVSDARRKFPFREPQVTISLADAREVWVLASRWARSPYGSGRRTVWAALHRLEPVLWPNDGDE